MNVKIVNTGSDGNCFLFGDSLLLDLGVSYKKLTGALGMDIGKISHVLLTHIHGDHFNETCVRKMFVNTDAIFVCGTWLIDRLVSLGIDHERILMVETGAIYDIGDFKISPVKAYHDVENCGYRIVLGDHKHFHITDTSTLEGITAKGYDTATIECNHCEVKAMELIEEANEKGEFSHLTGAINSHLSVQQTIEFCKHNSIKKLTPVHIGSSTKKEVVEALKRW